MSRTCPCISLATKRARLCIPSESAGIRRNPCKKGPSGRNVKVQSTGMCLVTTREKSDSEVNVGLKRVKANVDFDENYECLG